MDKKKLILSIGTIAVGLAQIVLGLIQKNQTDADLSEMIRKEVAKATGKES